MIARLMSRTVLAVALVVVMVAGVVVAVRATGQTGRTLVVGYFDNSTGVFPGDDVRILGVPVGRVEKIEPEPERVKIWFWFDHKYKVPADVNAVILSPQLVTGRAIQLTPAYTSGPTLGDGAEIPQSRTAVPVEWDDIRDQLQKLTELLQPTKPGGVSTFGEFVNTAADNLRGQGSTIRDTIIKLSQTLSALSDHKEDLFGTFKNLSTLVSALHDSTDLLEQLNTNLAAVTSLLADDPNKIGQTMTDLNAVVGDLQSFAADNREALGTTSDKLASITTALVDSLDDIEQALHIAPTTVPELQQYLRAGQRCADRRAVGQQLRQSDQLPLRSNSGGFPPRCRAGLQAVRAIPGADREEPPIQLPTTGFEPSRRDTGQAQRGHLQRGMDASGLRSPRRAPAPGEDSPMPAEAPGPPAPLAAEAPNAPPAETTSTDPAAGLPGMMVPPGGGG